MPDPDPPLVDPSKLGYYRASGTAFASLVFVLPFVLIYELGTWYFTFDPQANTEQRIVAFSLIRDGLAAMGATARWVAPASVISILLGLTILHRERMRVSPRTLLGMAGESVALALPLILFSLLLARIPLAGVPLINAGELGEGVVLSIGAGIYEELVFRLIGFAVLHFILVDFLSIRERVAMPLVVGISAIVFSLYHYWGPEDFAVQTFVFRTSAGLFFGGVLWSRGFGITAGAHASYDILICLLRELPHVGG